MARPGYSPPTRKAVSGPLLDEIHESLEKEMKKELDGKEGALAQDGWSNCHNEPVVASCVQVGEKSFYLDSKMTGSTAKTSENCKAMCQESIAEAKEKYNFKVTSVVTDNAKNMERMRQQLQEEDPGLTVYGCFCTSHELTGLGYHPHCHHEAYHRSPKVLQKPP